MNLTELKNKLLQASIQFMVSEGFSEDIAQDYVTVYDGDNKYDESYTTIWVGAELSYDALYELGQTLDPIIQSVDEDAYFDCEDVGLLVTAIPTSNLEESLTEAYKTSILSVSFHDIYIKDIDMDGYEEISDGLYEVSCYINGDCEVDFSGNKGYERFPTTFAIDKFVITEDYVDKLDNYNFIRDCIEQCDFSIDKTINENSEYEGYFVGCTPRSNSDVIQSISIEILNDHEGVDAFNQILWGDFRKTADTDDDNLDDYGESLSAENNLDESCLRTVDFGKIRIVEPKDINKKTDTFIKQDSVNEWNYYQLANGEIVAVENDLDESLLEDTGYENIEGGVAQVDFDITFYDEYSKEAYEEVFDEALYEFSNGDCWRVNSEFNTQSETHEHQEDYYGMTDSVIDQIDVSYQIDIACDTVESRNKLADIIENVTESISDKLEGGIYSYSPANVTDMNAKYGVTNESFEEMSNDFKMAKDSFNTEIPNKNFNESLNKYCEERNLYPNQVISSTGRWSDFLSYCTDGEE